MRPLLLGGKKSELPINLQTSTSYPTPGYKDVVHFKQYSTQTKKYIYGHIKYERPDERVGVWLSGAKQDMGELRKLVNISLCK